MRYFLLGLLCILTPICASMNNTKLFTNGSLLINHKITENDLWVVNGKIAPPQPHADEVIDLEGCIVAPGYIDIQINGAFGCDFSRNPEMLSSVAKQLPQYGVTAFLPTLISSTPEQYQKALPHLQPQDFNGEGAEVLGIHLEGPFFARAYAGAHQPEYLIPNYHIPLEDIYGSLNGVKIITLAPELPGGYEAIQKLKADGIIISAGHSGANFEQISSSCAAGVGLATHLFNAMPGLHHRNPGIIGAALINPKIPYSLIVDGCHLCPETVALAYQCNPEGLILISDATEALGLPNGKYKLGTMDIEVNDGQIYVLGTRTLAGSNLNLSRAVQLLYAYTGCSKEFALEAASLKPAQLLGIYPKKGSLAEGSDADFVVLSPLLEVKSTYIRGNIVK